MAKKKSTKKTTTKKEQPEAVVEEEGQEEEGQEEEQGEEQEQEEVETQELATTGTTAMGKVGPVPMGYDGFTEDDLIIPRVSIVQKSSDSVDKGCTVGNLISNISDEEMENIRCTPILYRKGMVHFIKPYQKGQKPDCRSNDALVPSPDVDKPYSTVCAKIVRRRLQPVCPEAIWATDEKTGKSMPPACNLCFNVIMQNDDTKMPFFMTFRSSALKPFKNFISYMWGQRKNLFSVSFLLSTEPKENSFGSFRVPKISDIETHDEATQPDLIEVYKGMQAMNLEDSFDDERNQGDDAGEYNDNGDSSFNPGELENDKF